MKKILPIGFVFAALLFISVQTSHAQTPTVDFSGDFTPGGGAGGAGSNPSNAGGSNPGTPSASNPGGSNPGTPAASNPGGSNPSPVNPGGSNPAPVNPGGSNPGPTPVNGAGTTFYIQNPIKFNTVGGIVGGFIQIFSYLAIIFAVIMLIWVGFKFILAQGNVEEMKKLKNMLMWIVVGVAIVIGARIIVQVVITTLGASGADPRIIQSANSALHGN